MASVEELVDHIWGGVLAGLWGLGLLVCLVNFALFHKGSTRLHLLTVVCFLMGVLTAIFAALNRGSLNLTTAGSFSVLQTTFESVTSATTRLLLMLCAVGFSIRPHALLPSRPDQCCDSPGFRKVIIFAYPVLFGASSIVLSLTFQVWGLILVAVYLVTVISLLVRSVNYSRESLAAFESGVTDDDESSVLWRVPAAHRAAAAVFTLRLRSAAGYSPLLEQSDLSGRRV
eukprot:TRINITY_DN4002_c0_g1_i1.p1 TRINITY_DN4002_c0_g1~~TRINITY_DN4002_c0_g1_i1.p1  ORF type:complete len:229 (+),score=5.77 TRINITY_DN4002_c0_g1_i1:46-732(+)